MSVTKQFARYVTQNIFGMLGISCYIIADTFFIAKAAGTDGITVLNLVLPIYNLIFAIGSMIYVQSSMFLPDGLKNFVYCCPINIYKDCRCQEELDGVVAKCPFVEEDRTKLHDITSKIWNSLVHSKKLIPKLPYMTSVIVRESDLIAIKYQDVYHIDHTVYYLDSSPISEETYNKLDKIRQSVPAGIYSVVKVNLNNILDTRYQHTTRL